MEFPRFETNNAGLGRAARRFAGAVLTGAAALGLIAAPVAAQTGTVIGEVVSGASAQPLPDVQVVVAGTGLGTVTNQLGRFVIPNVPVGEQTIEISLIGYGQERVAVQVPAGGSVNAGTVQMFTSAVELEGMVVTGTAIASQRREVGNSISLITAEDIEASGVKSVEDILRGKVLGVTVQGSSATVGAGSQVTVRGMNSLRGRNSPLIYVDGTRLNPRNTYEPGTNEAAQAPTILNSINPQDIDRIEVIKGAAATTLYGTEAAAGVIQIFTKRGGEGDARWTFATTQTLSDPVHVGPDSDPTGLHLNDCTFGGPLRPDQTTPDPGCPESGSWLKTAHSQDYNLSVRGGSESFSYFASAGASRETGIINVPDEFEDQQQEQINLRANFTFNPFDNLQIRLNNSYTRRDLRLYPDGDNSEGFLFNVTFLEEGETPNNDDSRVFEMSILQDIDHFTTGANINWQAMDNFRHRLNVGLDWSQSDQVTERPFGFWFPGRERGNRDVQIVNNRVLTVDYAGSWAYELSDDIRSTLSFGGQLIDREEKQLEADCEDFSGPGAKTLDSCEDAGIGSGLGLDEDRDGVQNGGFFVQEQLGWKNRLFLTGGFRADSHSAFGDGIEIENEFVFYPKAQLTYTLSDHDFFPRLFDTFRLRAAYGESGEPPPATASKTFFRVDGGPEGRNGFEITNLGNPEIGPEKTREFEGGFDAGLFGGRLTVQGTGFYRKTFDGLMPVDLTPSQGISETQETNAGEWRTKGFEGALDATLVDRRDFRLNLNTRYQFLDSKVLDIGLDEDNFFNVGTFAAGFKEGDPFPGHYNPRITNPDAIGVEPERTDTLEFLGQTQPPHEFSVGLNATLWERLTFEVFGFGQFGHVLEDDQAQDLAAEGLWPGCVGITERIEAGNLEGLTALRIAQCDPDFAGNVNFTQAFLFDADYFRIQSASVSYRLPEEWLPGALQAATLQFRATNLALFTDFPGIDPDALQRPATFEQGRVGGFAVPLPRRYALTLRANF